MTLYSAPRNYASLEHLNWVWSKSPDNQGEGKKPGVDGVSPLTFKANLPVYLEKIRIDLIKKQYQFQPLKAFFIDKGNGKERIICVPTVRDRLVQRLMAYHIIKKYDPLRKTHVDLMDICNPRSFGINGEGHIKAIDEALKERAKHPWILKTDIQSFFDNIDRELLLDKIRKKLPKKSSLIPLLEQVVACDIIRNQWHTDKVRLEKQKLEKSKGLRQGMPLSPLLSNFFLGRFDVAVQKQGFNMIRYADDLIVFCDSRSKCL